MTKINSILIPATNNATPVKIDVTNVPKHSTKAIMSVLNSSNVPARFDFELGSLYAEPSTGDATSSGPYNAYASQLLFKLGVTGTDGQMPRVYGPSLITGPLVAVESKKKKKFDANGAEVVPKQVTCPSSLDSDASETLCNLLEEMTGVDMSNGKVLRQVKNKKNAFSFFQEEECARISARLAEEHKALCDTLRQEAAASGAEFVAPKERKFTMSIDSVTVRNTWNAMNAVQKAPYEERAKVDEQRYTAEKESWDRAHPGCPVNVRSAYSFYVKGQGNEKATWPTMTDEQKAPYVTMSKNDALRLEAELADYKVYCEANGLNYEYQIRRVRKGAAKSGSSDGAAATGSKRKRAPAGQATKRKASASAKPRQRKPKAEAVEGAAEGAEATEAAPARKKRAPSTKAKAPRKRAQRTEAGEGGADAAEPKEAKAKPKPRAKKVKVEEPVAEESADEDVSMTSDE